MEQPILSEHFQARGPSSIRLAQIEWAKRPDKTDVINAAIGNVSLPMHPAMKKRLNELTAPKALFEHGVVKYSATVGLSETNEAFLHILASSGLSTKGLHCQVTDGGSQAMELVILGVCGKAGTGERPLLLLDPAYTNYHAFAERLGRKVITYSRHLQDNGHFTLPDLYELEQMIKEERPGAIVIIPYDNPTGQYFDHDTMVKMANLCVKHNIWMVSDEAYRELHYVGGTPSSVWAITEEEAPGITGRRISIETASKVWNACGLRIGALITDSESFHEKSVAENTAGLCSNTIGQYIFAALKEEPLSALKEWYQQQRHYYFPIYQGLAAGLKERLPGIIVANTDAALYTIIDLRHIVPNDFHAQDFVLFCAKYGKVMIGDRPTTLLMAPMTGFYNAPEAKKQLRLSYVESPSKMAMIPEVMADLLHQYLKSRE